MADYIQLPNGSRFPIKPGESETDAMMAALEQYPDAFAEKKEEPRKKGSAIGDYWTALKEGAIGSTKALADVAGADTALSKYFQQKGLETQQQYSPKAQEEMRQQAKRMQEAEASGSTFAEIKAGLQNVGEAPIRSTMQGLGSLAPYIPTMFLGNVGKMLRLSPESIAALESVAEAAPKLIGTAQGMGTVKGAIYDSVYQNELKTTGNESVARSKASAAQSYMGKNLDQILLGGGLGYAAASTGAEKLLTKAGMAEASEKLGPRVARAFGEEALTEGPQGAQERLASNIALQREGVDVPTMQGVLGQGVQEAVVGGLSGAPVAVVRGPDRAAQLQAEKDQRRRAIEEALAAQNAEQPDTTEYAPGQQMKLPGFEAAKEAAPVEEPINIGQLHNDLRLIKSRMEDLQEQAKTTPDLKTKQAIGQQYAQLETAKKEIETQISKAPKSTNDTLLKLKKQMQLAEENGDINKQVALAKKMQELGVNSIDEIQAIEDQQQKQMEIPLQPFKNTVESTDSYNQRVIGPTIADAREAAVKQREQVQAEIDRLRAIGAKASDPEYARLVREEHLLAKEIEDIKNGRFDTGVGFQGDLFGETESKVYGGEERTVERTVPEIRADLEIARAAGNRAAVSDLVEELRARNEKPTVDKTLTTEALKSQMPPMPENVQRQRAAADQRATAFANILSILKKYNQGRAKMDDLEAARKSLVDGMIQDIESTRGQPLAEGEKAQLEREANGLLGDLVRRFGDTRTYINKGTAKNPRLVPAQDSEGRFIENKVPDTGFPTVESAAQGYRTFGNPFAAAQSIKEGLDELRNNAVGTQTGPTFTAQYTPENTTVPMLREQLDRAFAKDPSIFTPEQRAMLERIADNLGAINQDTDRRNLIGGWLNRLNNKPGASASVKTATGYAAALEPLTNDVKDSLQALESAKQSDELGQLEFPLTKTVGGRKGKGTEPKGEVVAGATGKYSMYSPKPTGEERGTFFGSHTDFETYLASDALQQLRSDLNISGPTLARLEKRFIKPITERTKELQKEYEAYKTQLDQLFADRKKSFDELQKMNAEEIAKETKRIAEAQEKVKIAKQKFTAVVRAIQEELIGSNISYLEARVAFDLAVKTSEDITKAIKENARNFTANEDRAVKALEKAKAELDNALAMTLADAKKSAEPTKQNEPALTVKRQARIEPLQMKVVTATRNLQRILALSNTEPKVLAYLNKDLDLQIQLMEQSAQVDQFAEELKKAGDALGEAKKELEKSDEFKEATEELTTAQEALAEEQRKANDRAESVASLEKDLGFELAEVEDWTTGGTKTISRLVKDVDAVSSHLRQAMDAIDAQLEPIRKASRVVENFIKRRDAASSVKMETQTEREENDRKQRALELSELDRLAAIPGQRISFEKRREVFESMRASEQAITEMLDRAAEAENTIQNFESADQKLSEDLAVLEKQISKLEKQTAANPRTFKTKLIRSSRLVELEGLRDQQAKMVRKREQLKNGLEVLKAELEKGDSKIAELLVLHSDAEALFSNDPDVANETTAWYDSLIERTQNNIGKVQQRLAQKQTKELRTSRLNDLSKYKQELKKYQKMRDASRGITRTEVGAIPTTGQNQAEILRLKAEINQLEVEKSNATSRKEVTAFNKDIKAKTTRIEELQASLPVGVEAGTRLAPRKIGPVVRKVVQAGNVRTGTAETIGERTLSNRNKAAQSGKPRELTAKQAMRSAAKDTALEAAMIRMADLDMVREKAVSFLAIAQEKGDPILERKYTDAIKRIDAERAELEKAGAKSIGPLTEVFRGDSESRATTYSSSNTTQADEITKGYIKRGDFAGAIKHLVSNAQTKLLRDNALLLLSQVKDVRVVIIPNLTYKGERVPALYNPEVNAVAFDPEGITEENIIHEATHAATKGAWDADPSTLSKEQLFAKREIERIYNIQKNRSDLKDQYGIKDAEEFMSEIQSNERFREAVAKQPWYKRLWQAILRLANIKVDSVKDIDRHIRTLYSPAKAHTGEARAASPDALLDLTDRLIAKPRTFREKLGSNVALQTEMELVDMRAPLREALKAGDDKLYQQAIYNVLKADQKMAIVQATLTDGAMEASVDEAGLHVFKSSNKNSAVPVFKAMSDIPLPTAKDRVNAATTYLVAQRALNKGVNKLDIGALGINEQTLRNVMREVDANPELKQSLESVRTAYNAYNEGLINFLASSGKIPKEKAKELLKDGDYAPYYRVLDNGTAELVYGDNITVSIGDIRNQPYLHSLKGGETKILPLDESIYRNTMLLTDAALTNMATKSTAYALQALGRGAGGINVVTGKPTNKMAIQKGKGPDSPNVLRFNQEPDPDDAKDDGSRWLQVNTEGTLAEDVPTALVVESLQGAHLPLPSFLKVAGYFSDLLRSGVTRMPMYIGNQLLRDPMSATFTSGLDYGPFRAVAKAGKEFWAMSTGDISRSSQLIERGLIQSNIFAGDQSDISKIALQLASGKDQSALEKVFAFLDKAALNADSATRILVYENARKRGLSDGQAQIATMESMNFYKRGRNPLVQYGNRLIPFLNAGIQGLNVLVKAMRGNMPYQEALQIKQKFYRRAVFLFAVGVAYAMAMEDDDYYKNARPRDKYTKLFLHLPGVEEPLKLPTPFEAGYFFSLAVATVDAMRNEVPRQEQWDALRTMFIGSIPGASSMGVPQILRPMIEVYANKNFYNNAPIESARLANLDVEKRFTPNTTEFAKMLARYVPGLSPVQIEHLANGYLGQAPMMIASAVNWLFASEDRGEAPEKRLHELPFVGQAFQRKYGGAESDYAYRLAEEAMQARATFNDMRKKGLTTDAAEYRLENRERLAMASAAGAYREAAGHVNTDIERTRNRTDLSGEEKTIRIERLEKIKQDLAERFTTRYERMQGQR